MQQEYFGKGSLYQLETIIARHQARRLLLVTGKSSYNSCGAAEIINTLCKGYEVQFFHDFSVNPKLEEAIGGIELLNSFKPDVIIAVGGGSVLDMGKLITFFQAQDTEDYESIIKARRCVKKGIPFVAVPTTAGTGSESTRYAVVYINGVKYSLTHGFVMPDYAIIDPTLTFNTPPYQTAASGMDAFCQAIESHWSVNATAESRSFSSTAMKELNAHLKDSVLSGAEEARVRVSYGANLSGKAINITETTAPHAISYPLTSHWGIPHGHAVALLMGKFLSLNSVLAEKMARSVGFTELKRSLEDIYLMLGCPDGESCSEKWYELMGELGLETDFKKLGIHSPDDYQRIADSVNPQRLKNHPVSLSRDAVISLFSS